jgi:branched-chain amino acid transport system ATP-binding protein
MTTAIELRGVTSGYGDIVVVRDADLAVKEGTTLGIVGPNGAGKTTLLRSISQLTNMRSGEIYIFGERVTRRNPAVVARMGVAHVPEGRRVFANMSVVDNLLVGGYNDVKSQPTRLEYVYDLFPRLGERHRQRAQTLSGGEQQMLAIGRALMMGPKILMLDEPSQGLSPAMVIAVLSSIARIAEDGVTTLIVEQNGRGLLAVMDDGVVMRDGHVSARQSARELVASGVLNSLLSEIAAK